MNWPMHKQECQDIVLKAIATSSLSRNVTIKGGVVMRSITNNIRRATQDMDIDFIRYSLSDESIDRFIEKLNCLDGILIKRVGKIEELSQQDYKGKRVYIHIVDSKGDFIESKIDLGVHKHLEIEQEEYCFDIGFDDEGASLLINTREHVFRDNTYKKRVDKSDSRWLDDDIEEVFGKILDYLNDFSRLH